MSGDILQKYLKDNPTGQLFRVVEREEGKCVYMHIDGEYLCIGTEHFFRELLDYEAEAIAYNDGSLHINSR